MNAVGDGIGAVGDDIAAVRDDIDAVGDGIGAVGDDIGAVRDDIGAVSDSIDAVGECSSPFVFLPPHWPRQRGSEVAEPRDGEAGRDVHGHGDDHRGATRVRCVGAAA